MSTRGVPHKPERPLWSCSHCGPHPDSDANWCAAGCGRDFAVMTVVPRTMSTRDDLANVVWEAVFYSSDHDINLHDDQTTAVADAVLEYLGNLDGSVDGELVAWHLRNDRQEIARLRESVAQSTRMAVDACAEAERLRAELDAIRAAAVQETTE